MTADTVIIVGAGQAGVSAALELRRAGFSAAIRLYSEEAEWPYDRPPLSKSFHHDEGASPATILSEAEAATHGIDLVRGIGVVSLAPQSRQIRLPNDAADVYGTLILATGGSVKAIPALAVDNTRVFSLRTYTDARRIAAALAHARDVAVIGGGWLGLEIAAAAGTLGKNVSIFEVAPQLCPRSLPREVGSYLQHMHTARGIAIHTSADVAFERGATRIHCHHRDGQTGSFDIAVVATGIQPRIDLATTAGIACDDGILTDGAGRTSEADIYAIGDVARLHHDGMGQRLRLESWTNAATQGALVAQAICGGNPRYTAAPWFWSEQFGRLIQVAGLPSPDLTLLSMEDGDRPLWRYGRGGRLAAIIGIDRAKDVRAASRQLTAELECTAGGLPPDLRRQAPG